MNPILKSLLTLTAVLPLTAMAQDSCQLKRETDPFTHQQKISTGFVPFVINGKQVSISIDATDKEIDYFFWIQNDGACFDTESTAQVNYEGDRLKASFKNTGSMNCDGAFHFTFRNLVNSPAHLARLSDKNVASIKLTGTGKTVTELSFTPEQREKLKRMTACVVREAKTLIK
jgi:hypothetical protein